MKKFWKSVVDFLKKYMKYVIIALIFLGTLYIATDIVESWKDEMLFDLRVQVYSNEDAIDDLERDISWLQDDISYLKDSISNLTDGISNLEYDISDLEYDIYELY